MTEVSCDRLQNLKVKKMCRQVIYFDSQVEKEFD